MTETTVLALYGLLVLLTILLQATGAMQQLGMGYLMSSRDEHRTVKGMTARLGRALDNSVVAMALFAPAVLLLVATDKTGNGSLLATQVFLLARVVYLPAYIFGIVGVRTLAWLFGFATTIILYLMAL
ncbi:MAPEG family protein [Sulfitobacter sabulilitoris]|uniref:MAPEG family protein n=1 Tax=Sulfitobacter sabulilitoris TaxID=2562655 RepID=A0A5S3PCJ7_9RHOB|nr:MAPEG family protein [Sulfitobacter sabulilitoris]TMM51589.1 MAPEG family protein [Sulfitobacter sabulilitoris]